MALLLSPLSRRALWAGPYALRRLGTERVALLAEPHYALIGEARGFRPNGFFAPAFYREAAGLGRRASDLLAHYLARPERAAPSPEFDAGLVFRPASGMAKSPSASASAFSRGRPCGRLRPRADIDMAFVRDVVRGRGRSTEEAAMRVFDPKPRDSEMAPPLSREELHARQDRFYAERQMRVLKEPGETDRKLLVFVQSGKSFDAPWLTEPRAFDVLLNAYEERPVDPQADTFVARAARRPPRSAGSSKPARTSCSATRRSLFLDDDVEISKEGIETLFPPSPARASTSRSPR